jgi:glutamate decarboxylase
MWRYVSGPRSGESDMCRILPVSEESHHCLDPELVKQNIDENTIGVFVILGSTYTGHYEPVEAISNILDEYERKTGVSIDIHVDVRILLSEAGHYS